MKCPNCEAENIDTQKFCSACGSKLVIICPRCGVENHAKNTFCEECGRYIVNLSNSPTKDALAYNYQTPSFITNQIIASKDQLQGERKLITVLFCDIVNYTSMSEKLDPEEIYSILSNYYDIVTKEIHTHEGTVDKYLGDGIMALFGAPIAREDHSNRACYSALAIQTALNQYNKEVEKQYNVSIKTRIGIHSGMVRVGSIGNDLRMEYTAIGDTTNLASRMEGIAKPGSTVVSSETYRLTKDYFRFQSLGPQSIKGKENLLEAFELLDASEIVTRIGASIEKGLTNFVGRDDELNQLFDCYQKAKKGNGQLVGIVGEAGVGKSRLILELNEILPKDEYSFLEGWCIHYGSSMSYTPVIDILRSFFSLDRNEPEDITKRKMTNSITELGLDPNTLLPPLQSLLSRKLDNESFLDIEPQYKKKMTIGAVNTLLVSASKKKPLVIVIEDLHWIDRASEELLNYLMDSISKSSILLLLLYRPEYSHSWNTKEFYTHVYVGQLSMSSRYEMLKSILACEEVEGGIKYLINDRSDGNPLFIEEFTFSLVENGIITRNNDKYELCVDPSNIQIPDTLHGIIAARIDRLEENLKSILQTASVIGREFTCEVVQKAMGKPEENKSEISKLEQLEFIYKNIFSQELEYIFKHALIQEVAYNSILLEQRKKIHKNIGSALENLYSNRYEELYETLAYHFQRGDSTDKAVYYLKKSGKKNYEKYAIDAANRYYREAFSLLSSKMDKSTNDITDLIDIIIEWALVFYSRGAFRELDDILRAHRAIVESLGDEERLGMYIAWQGSILHHRGKMKESDTLLRMALNIGEKISNIQVIGYACSWLVWTCLEEGLFDEAIAFGEKAMHISKSIAGDHYLYFHSLAGIACAYIYMGNYKATADACQTLVEYGEHFTNLRSTVMGFAWMTLNYTEMGNLKSAIENIKPALEVNVDHFYSIIRDSAFALTYISAGYFDEAEEIAQKVLNSHAENGHEQIASHVQIIAGIIYMAKGRLSKGLKIVEESRKEMLLNERRVVYVLYTHILGRIYVEMAERTVPLSISEMLRNCGFIIKNIPFAKRKAELLLNEAIQIGETINTKGFVAQSYLDLGRLYKLKNKKKQAKNYTAKAIKLFEYCNASEYLAEAKALLESIN